MGSLTELAVERGELDRAAELGEEALGLARELGNPVVTAFVHSVLGTIVRFQGEPDWAAALYGEGPEIHRELGPPWGIVSALTNLAAVAREGGDPRRAAGLLGEVAGPWRSSADPPGTAEILHEAALLRGAGGGWEGVVRLLGAAVREALGAPLPPSRRRERERTVSVSRAPLGEAAAWAAGGALSLEAAMDEALGEAPLGPRAGG